MKKTFSRLRLFSCLLLLLLSLFSLAASFPQALVLMPHFPDPQTSVNLNRTDLAGGPLEIKENRSSGKAKILSLEMALRSSRAVAVSS